LDKTCPIKVMNIAAKQDPWITCGLIKLLMVKKRLGQVAVATKHLDNWQRYVSIRRESVKAIRKARTNYIKTAEIAYKQIPNKFWEIIHSVFPCQETQAQIRIESEGALLEGELAAAELNRYFSEIGRKLANKFENWPQKTLNQPDLVTTIGTCATTSEDISRLATQIDST